jgi:hypothetical protein
VFLHVLMLPDHERAGRIGQSFGDPRTQTLAQLLIDLEESPHVRAVVLGERREREPRGHNQAQWPKLRRSSIEPSR